MDAMPPERSGSDRLKDVPCRALSLIGLVPRRVLALVLLIGLAVPAGASSVERTVLVETGVSVEEACGVDWSVSTDSRVLVLLKAGTHGDLTPRFSANTHSRLVYTDPSDPDRGFVISDNGLFVKDVHVTRISGTLYEFNSIAVGRSAISTLAGRTIAADTGHVSWTFLIDTHGSVDLDDYELLDGTMTKVSGRHPILDSGDGACELIMEAIG